MCGRRGREREGDEGEGEMGGTHSLGLSCRAAVFLLPSPCSSSSSQCSFLVPCKWNLIYRLVSIYTAAAAGHWNVSFRHLLFYLKEEKEKKHSVAFLVSEIPEGEVWNIFELQKRGDGFQRMRFFSLIFFLLVVSRVIYAHFSPSGIWWKIFFKKSDKNC